jgi:hypothetical protein
MRAFILILAGVLILASGAVQAQDTSTQSDVYRADHTQAQGGYGMSSGPGGVRGEGVIQAEIDAERRGYEEGYLRGQQRGRIEARDDIRGRVRTYQQPFEEEEPEYEIRGGFGSGVTRVPWGESVRTPQERERQLRLYQEGYDRGFEEGRGEALGRSDMERREFQQDRRMMEQRDMRQQPRAGQQSFEEQWPEYETRGGFGGGATMTPYGESGQAPRSFDQQYGPEGQRDYRTQPYDVEQQRSGQQYDTQQGERSLQGGTTDQQTQPYGGAVVQPRAGEQAGVGQQQTFTGTVDRAGDMHVLIVNGSAYELDAENEEQLRSMIGQRVEVRGTLDDDTIQAQSINRVGETGTSPGSQQ